MQNRRRVRPNASEGRPGCPGARCLLGTDSLAFPKSGWWLCYLAFSSPEPARALFSSSGSRSFGGGGLEGDGAVRGWTIDTSK